MKVWIAYTIAVESDSYYDNIINKIFKEKPSVEQLKDLYSITLSTDTAEELLEDHCASDEDFLYYLQEVEFE